jgi:penicillin amidase
LRTLGTYRAAQAALPSLSPNSRMALDAYAAGINGWLAENHPLPPEFVILGFKPQPWQPVDSLVWAKMMAWDLGGNYDGDLLRSQLAAALGPERTAQLFPGYPADAPTILPPSSGSEASALRAMRAAIEVQYGIGGEGKGSNNWVVSGSRTASGKPLLANDPHLRMQMPSVWYLAGLQGDKFHAVGATFPGLPAVVIGHNSRVAWGMTNLGPDVQDLFVERINPANPNQYEVNGTWVDMEIHAEDIAVKGQKEPVHLAARATRHGPLISDANESRGNAFALRWTALDPGDTSINAFLGINYAGNWAEFKSALTGYFAPSQNFVYADVDGNIGYFGPGHIPIRAKGDGSLPVPGWNDEYAWTGWIPFEELPQAYNPADGYVVTANNKVVPADYPYFISNDWAPPYRAERITEMLTAKQGLTPDDYAAIQADQQSAQARELLPYLLKVQPAADKPLQSQALAYLKTWDGTSSEDSVAATIYEAWYAKLHSALLADKVGGTLAEMTTTANPGFLREVLGGQLAVWCDDVLTPKAEGCDDTARVALDQALEMLDKSHGGDMARWRWGDVHQVQFAHNPMSQVSALKRFFHRTVSKGGDAFTVNPAGFSLQQPFDATSGPSYREIIDLSNLDNSRFMHTTGQSGNVLSAHYDDFLQRWKNTEYVPMHWDRARLESESGLSKLVLQPR